MKNHRTLGKAHHPTAQDFGSRLVIVVSVFLLSAGTMYSTAAHASTAEREIYLAALCRSHRAASTERMQTSAAEDPLGVDLWQAHRLAQNGQEEPARRLFHKVRRSAFPWHAWAATSGLIAFHRKSGDVEAALSLIGEIEREQPSLRPLMAIWTGDIRLGIGDFVGAESSYRQAIEESPPSVETVALKQLIRLAIHRADPRKAAAWCREAVRRGGSSIQDTELFIAKAALFDIMAADRLPTVTLGTFLESSLCTASKPCLAHNAHLSTWQNESPGLKLADLTQLRFVLSAADRELLEKARSRNDPGRQVLDSVCTPSTASDGFGSPALNSPASVDPLQRWMLSAARGCVRDADPTRGALAVEHRYPPRSWFSHSAGATSIYYSIGAAVIRGAILGTAPSHSDLVHELRRSDHPFPADLEFASRLSPTLHQAHLEDIPSFSRAHHAYSELLWADEGAFQKQGTWQYVTGLGSGNDLRWASTHGTISPTAGLTFRSRADGTYNVWVSIPSLHADHPKVVYSVAAIGGGLPLLETEVHQEVVRGTWVHLGQVELEKGAQYRLEVSVKEGGKRLSHRLALDDILLLKPRSQNTGSSDL